jgi:hypothetical protein
MSWRRCVVCALILFKLDPSRPGPEIAPAFSALPPSMAVELGAAAIGRASM